MKGQIDTIEILVENQGLISVEWETLDEVSTKLSTRRAQDFFSHRSGDDFVGIGRRVWSDVLVKWEDLFEEGIDALGLWVDDNSGDGGESESVDVLIVVGVLLFITVDNFLLDGVSDKFFPICSHWLFLV